MRYRRKRVFNLAPPAKGRSSLHMGQSCRGHLRALALGVSAGEVSLAVVPGYDEWKGARDRELRRRRRCPAGGTRKVGPPPLVEPGVERARAGNLRPAATREGSTIRGAQASGRGHTCVEGGERRPRIGDGGGRSTGGGNSVHVVVSCLKAALVAVVHAKAGRAHSFSVSVVTESARPGRGSHSRRVYRPRLSAPIV